VALRPRPAPGVRGRRSRSRSRSRSPVAVAGRGRRSPNLPGLVGNFDIWVILGRGGAHLLGTCDRHCVMQPGIRSSLPEWKHKSDIRQGQETASVDLRPILTLDPGRSNVPTRLKWWSSSYVPSPWATTIQPGLAGRLCPPPGQKHHLRGAGLPPPPAARQDSDPVARSRRRRVANRSNRGDEAPRGWRRPRPPIDPR
jgi:hypothetical protein